ncbi:MAG: hypothetical protein M9919_04825 [Burkholderiaceae bacterium]|nr:hypothetical protein [Burkholderiaceae bacterium]MCO5103311.1 hypothetical protein [Burkholderiaceae bacterium]MCO5109248.1 hypothetical protein [Burkholderiaceae bacterium]
MNIPPPTLRAFFGTLLWIGVAAHAASESDAQARYERDRAACLSGQTQQARDVCLREAGAARDAARKGALTGSGAHETAANALERCKVFTKTDEHAACVDRIRGAGNSSGSALEGGILRESVTTTTTVLPAKR